MISSFRDSEMANSAISLRSSCISSGDNIFIKPAPPLKRRSIELWKSLIYQFTLWTLGKSLPCSLLILVDSGALETTLPNRRVGHGVFGFASGKDTHNPHLQSSIFYYKISTKRAVFDYRPRSPFLDSSVSPASNFCAALLIPAIRAT